MSYPEPYNTTRNVVIMPTAELEDERTRRRRQEFGLFLRLNREAADRTQQQAADIAEVSLRHWQRLESGESGTDRDKIPAIAKGANADLRETYLRAGFQPPPELRATQGFDRSDFARLYSKYSKLKVNRQKEYTRILTMVDADLDRELLEQEKEGEE